MATSSKVPPSLPLASSPSLGTMLATHVPILPLLTTSWYLTYLVLTASLSVTALAVPLFPDATSFSLPAGFQQQLNVLKQHSLSISSTSSTSSRTRTNATHMISTMLLFNVLMLPGWTLKLYVHCLSDLAFGPLTDHSAPLQRDHHCTSSMESPSAPQARWCGVPLPHRQIIALWEYGSGLSRLSPAQKEYHCFFRFRIVRMICQTLSAVLTIPVVVRWKNTLYLGIDTCFKLKLKDRGFNDPDLCPGSAYMVNKAPYQEYLNANTSGDEPVSVYWLLHQFIVLTMLCYDTGLYLLSGSPCHDPSTHEAHKWACHHGSCCCFV